MRRGGLGARHGRVLGVPHIVARADSNGELGEGEEVQDSGRVGVGLELAAGGVVRGVLGVVLIVQVNPALEIAELVLRVQAAPVGVGRRRLQGHHELVIHGTVNAAAIDDADGHRARARADAGVVGVAGRPSANASDQEAEEHLLRVESVRVSAKFGVGGGQGW
eukprot:scaffold12070_cov59-Phaeocystis_antarctica.AAC.1